jgi:hypothetical protein
VRTEQDKWRVPEEDPAGRPSDNPQGIHQHPLESGAGPAAGAAEGGARAGLIYCGLCSALNPASSYYCAACGATLVDAFHASEGLRVFAQPDTASRIIEIVTPGSELDVVEDPDAPEDFVRVKLAFGRLGYIRVADIDTLQQGQPQRLGVQDPDINIAARGCITQTSALAALVLLLALGALVMLYVQQSDSAESGIVALAACVVIGPLLLLTIGMFVFARERDERLAEEAEMTDGSGS